MIYRSLIIYSLFSFTSVFVYRAIKLQTFAADKNHEELAKQIAAAIPKNSNVIGSETYYYGVTSNQINFQYINILIPPIKDQSLVDLPRTIEKMIEIHKTTFKPQYFIIETENDRRSRDIMIQNEYFKNFNLVPYKKIIIGGNDNDLQKWLKKLYKKMGLATPPNYNGMIYKVL